jgi:hypothetical protein
MSAGSIRIESTSERQHEPQEVHANLKELDDAASGRGGPAPRSSPDLSGSRTGSASRVFAPAVTAAASDPNATGKSSSTSASSSTDRLRMDGERGAAESGRRRAKAASAKERSSARSSAGVAASWWMVGRGGGAPLRGTVDKWRAAQGQDVDPRPAADKVVNGALQQMRDISSQSVTLNSGQAFISIVHCIDCMQRFAESMRNL